MITTITLTENEYNTLIYLCNGETVFKTSELLKEPLSSFIGNSDINTTENEYIHFVKEVNKVCTS